MNIKTFDEIRNIDDVSFLTWVELSDLFAAQNSKGNWGKQIEHKKKG